MGSVAYAKDELVGLRVVRGPNWKWGTQDGGEGFVGTVIGINEDVPRFVKVRWDSGKYEAYRGGVEENCYDLRVLDNSTVGVKHPGVECQGCGQKVIAGLRWQCLDCPALINLCTFCFTNRKHDQRHVNFKRYDRPSSIPATVCVNGKQKIQLKGIFPGALVRRGVDWKYNDEDGVRDVIEIDHEFGKVMPVPTGREITPGKVWVQWPHDKEPYSYRVGFKGKMDLEIANAAHFSCGPLAATGGHYQPDTLPVLEISEPRAEEKPNDVVAEFPFVVGDRVKFVVGLEELREMSVDCGLGWSTLEKKIVNMVGTITKIDKRDNTVRVLFPKDNGGNGSYSWWCPVKAMQRLIPWLPVGAIVQVSIKKSSSKATTKEEKMMNDFGRVKIVRPCGKKVMLEFSKPNGRVVIKPFHVNRLKVVDVSVKQKVEDVKRYFANLLLTEVKKGATLSVKYLMKSFPNMIDPINSQFNDTSCIALNVACRKGNIEIVKLLLEHEESCTDEEDELEEFSVGPIHSSVYGNHPEVLQLLLGNGYNPNYKDTNNETPLHVAVKSRHLECLRILLKEQGLHQNTKNKDGETPMQIAVKYSHLSVETLNIFLDAGKLNLTPKENEDIVYLATEHNNFEAAKFLMSIPEGRKSAQNSCGVLRETSLHVACRLGHNQIAKLLVEQLDKDEKGRPWGIDIQVSGSSLQESGNTPLMEVIQQRNCELIETLIGAGANLHAITNEGHTAFHYGVRLVHNKKLPAIHWPNGVTSPDIFEIYNELKLNTKHRDDELCLVTAIVLYIVKKGGIPQNLALPEIKNLISDDFLYGEIIKTFACPHSTSQNFTNQSNPSECSQPNELNGINGYPINKVQIESFDNILKEHYSDSTPSTQQNNNLVFSNLLPPAGVTVMTLHQDSLPSQNEVTTRDSIISSIPQPSPSSQQHRVTSDIFCSNENVPGTVTPAGETAANTVAATSVGEHPTPSDNNGSIPAATDVPHMSETTNNENVPNNNQQTADISSVDSVPSDSRPTEEVTSNHVAAGRTRTPEEITCTIEEKLVRKRKGGPTEEKTSWIIIDESGRRYSQQKTNVCDIFQCTANVSSSTNPNGSKKCKGTIYVQDLAGKIEEWETNPGKKFTFTVRNAHEEHLPNKRGIIQTTETESDSPATSRKRKKEDLIP